MFHDPSLERTTDGKGFIRDQAWSGGIEHLRTMKEPRQQIPTFEQLCELLMQPENMHVKLNVSQLGLCRAEREMKGQLLTDSTAYFNPHHRSTSKRTIILIDYSD